MVAAALGRAGQRDPWLRPLRHHSASAAWLFGRQTQPGQGTANSSAMNMLNPSLGIDPEGSEDGQVHASMAHLSNMLASGAVVKRRLPRGPKPQKSRA